jgi:hypothetical protein
LPRSNLTGPKEAAHILLRAFVHFINDKDRHMKALASDAGIQLAEIDDRRQNSDRRGLPRRKIIKGGRTFWPNGDSSECIVYNLSASGAHLEIRGPAPNVFDLEIDGDRSRRSCVVVWRKAKRIGVKFQGRP